MVDTILAGLIQHNQLQCPVGMPQCLGYGAVEGRGWRIVDQIDFGSTFVIWEDEQRRRTVHSLIENRTIASLKLLSNQVYPSIRPNLQNAHQVNVS